MFSYLTVFEYKVQILNFFFLFQVPRLTANFDQLLEEVLHAGVQ